MDIKQSNQKIKMHLCNSITISASVIDSCKEKMDVTDIIWETNDFAIDISEDKCTAIPINVGEASITVKYHDLVRKINFEIMPPQPTGIIFSYKIS